MKRYNIKTFYGSYGKVTEYENGNCNLELIWNGAIPQEPYRNIYYSLSAVKKALGQLCGKGQYKLTECE